jgi:NDP-sugar pyrophosphorylase family protein
MIASPSLADCPVVILAGGLGNRLRSVIPDRPKGLAPIGDQPFLEIQISLLRDQGARQFVLCVGHGANQIREHLGDGSRLGTRIQYSVEEGGLLGTAGALRLAERFFRPRALVLNGDTYLATSYALILAHHIEERMDSRVVATLTLARLQDAQRFGSVVLDSTERHLAGFREKITGQVTAGWLNAGAYVIERDLLERIPRDRPCSLEHDVFPSALHDGLRIAAHPCPHPFFDIGTAEDFQGFVRLYGEWAQQANQAIPERRAG